MKINKLLIGLSVLAMVGCAPTTTTSGSNPSSGGDTSNTDTSTGGNTTDPIEESYSVKIENTVSGVTLTSDKAKAKKGETVTITVTITDSKYQVKGVNVDNKPCNKVDDSTYTFVMLDHPVTVKADIVVEGDVTIQGEISAVFEKEGSLYVARNVKVSKKSKFNIVVKTDDGTKTLDITSFDRFKTFADISYAMDDQYNLEIAGNATYDFYYDINNGNRPCYVKRTNVDILPNSKDSLYALFHGYVGSMTSVYPENLLSVDYTNKLASEHYVYESYKDNVSMATIKEISTEGEVDKAVVYSKLEGDTLTVVDNYTPSTNKGFANNFVAKKDNVPFSGLYKVSALDEEGLPTLDNEFEYKEEFVNSVVAENLLTSSDKTMEFIEADIMYSYRVGLTVEDAVKQASVNISSADNEDGTFVTSIVSSKTYDSTQISDAVTKEQYHSEYRVELVFDDAGVLLNVDYEEKRFDSTVYDFTSFKWLNGDTEFNYENNGTMYNAIKATFTYGDKTKTAPSFDTSKYFVSSISNLKVNNDKVPGENTLNIGDVIDDYLTYDFAPATALNSYQYKVIDSSNEEVVALNKSNKYQVVGNGTSTLTFGIKNGLGESASVDVTCSYTIKLRNLILWSNYGEFAPTIDTISADVYTGVVTEFGMIAYNSENNKQCPVPFDLTPVIQGDDLGIKASVDHAKGTLILDTRNAVVSETTDIKILMETDYYDLSWSMVPVTFTFHVKKGSSVLDLVGTYTTESYPGEYVKFTQNDSGDEKLPYLGEIFAEGKKYNFNYNYDPVMAKISCELTDEDMFLSDLVFDYNVVSKELGVYFAVSNWDSEGQTTEEIYGYLDEEGFPIFEIFTKSE